MATKVSDLEAARQEVAAAEIAYKEAEAGLAAVGTDVTSTPERVLAERQHREQIEAKAVTLIEAKERFDRAAAEATERDKVEGARELAAVIPNLEAAAVKAEQQMDRLVDTLTELVALARQRYVATKKATGKASVGLLLRNPIAGWFAHRLAPLDLPGEHAPGHYRHPLVEMLGIRTEERGEQHGTQKS